jgi:hypothetical protein
VTKPAELPRAFGRIATAILTGAGLVLGATPAVNAQAQYREQSIQAPPHEPAQPPYPASPYNPLSQPYRQVPAVPPSWNYDPYTDGTVPTPHGGSG